MGKGDIWLPQKADPMPGKIPEAEADAFNHKRGGINTWPQIDRSGQKEDSNIRFWVPWSVGLPNICHMMRA